MLHGQPNPALLASLRILYQPIVRLADMRVNYAEVLARAEGDDGAIQGPERIVDAMTSAEVSLSLTAAIMQRGLAEYAAYGFAAHGVSLAFNLPLDALLHPELAARIEAMREAAGLAPEVLRFELTETSPVQDFPAAAASIVALHAAGYGIALDDITPDMPYLDELMRLPIRAIKFDHKLVGSTDPAARAFIAAMAARAAERGQDAIAEGIETPTQLAAMRAAAVTHGQGYLFSRPLPAMALEDYLSRN